MPSNTDKALKGMSSQALVTVLLGVLEVVSFAIMSRVLSKEDFGFYAAINAIVLVFASISETGIGTAIVQKKEINSRYIGNAFTLSVIIGLISTIVLFVAALFLPEKVVSQEMRIPLMLMSVTLFLNCVTSVFRSILHRQLKFLQMGVVQLIALFITTVVAVLLALKGYGFYAIITKAILGSIISSILFYVLSRTKYSLMLDKETFKDIFGFSGWLMASAFFRDLSKQIDKLIMPRVMSIGELGAYTRPKDFINTFSGKINGIFDGALFPILSSLQDDKAALASAYKRSLFSMNLFSLLLALAFAINAELLLRLFFGAEWLYLTPVFIIFSALVFFNADGRIADCYLRSLGKTKEQFYFRIIEFMAKTIGVLAGFKWGLIGVAIGTTLMECVIKLVKVIYAGSLVSISMHNTLRILLQSCRFTIVLIPACLLVYFLSAGLTREIVVLVVFIILSLILFLFCPSLVGEDYKNDLYPTIRNYAYNLLRKLSHSRIK